MPAAVSRQEDAFHAGEFTEQQIVGRRAPRGLDTPLFATLEPGDVVEAGPANDTNDGGDQIGSGN